MDELNGTTVILESFDDNDDNAVDITGQLEVANAYVSNVIDISNKSEGDWVALLDVNLGGKGVTTSGSMVYNTGGAYKRCRTDSDTGKIRRYRLQYRKSGDLYRYIFFGIINVGDSFPHGDKVTSSFTVTTTGEVEIRTGPI